MPAHSGSVPPEVPTDFLATPNPLAGPHDAVTIPRGSEKTDGEVELGVVTGPPTAHLDSPSESLEHAGGFVLCNDLSERDLQLRTSGAQWSKGKCAPGFSLSGTPDGVALSGRFPHLRAADVVEIETDGLGHQRQQMVAYR